MDRYLLDTNVYGFIVVDNERSSIHRKISNNKSVIIYGFDIVRKELRATRRIIVNMNLRMDLLRLYDDIVKKTYEISNQIKEVAQQYYDCYREIKGSKPKEKLMNDLLIISCASIKNLDIVVSNDIHTMLSDSAIKAYTIVNKKRNLPLPRFISYEEFKNVLKK